jgi:hypothetical protein
MAEGVLTVAHGGRCDFKMFDNLAFFLFLSFLRAVIMETIEMRSVVKGERDARHCDVYDRSNNVGASRCDCYIVY